MLCGLQEFLEAVRNDMSFGSDIWQRPLRSLPLLPLSFKTLDKDFVPAASRKRPLKYRFHSAAAALPLEAAFPNTAQPNTIPRQCEGRTWRLSGSLGGTNTIHQPHHERPVALETPRTPLFLSVSPHQQPRSLLFWQIQGFFSLAVTSRASVSSSSSPSESRSEICCCSSGLMLFSARMSVRRAVG